jgi:hypothetical protein
MRRKTMDIQRTYALSVRGCSLDRNKNNSSSERSKYRGRYKASRKYLSKCWKCRKYGHFERDCRSKSVERGKGFDDVPSTKGKTSSKEGGDVYMVSSSMHVDHDVWLINSGASFHMTPHREWFCEYKKYNGGKVFIGGDSIAKIIGQGKFKLQHKDGRIRTLHVVLQILELARNLIYVSKMSDASVHTMFENETYKMVRGEMVLMRGVQNGTLYKLLGSTINNGCNIYVVPEGGNEYDQTPTVSREKTMLWNQILGHIGENGLQELHGKGMVEGMSNCTMDFDFCEHYIYGKQNWVRFASGVDQSYDLLKKDTKWNQGVMWQVGVDQHGDGCTMRLLSKKNISLL